MPSRRINRNSPMLLALTKQVEKSVADKLSAPNTSTKKKRGTKQAPASSGHPVNALISTLSPEGASYAAGLSHPFSDMADGCRIPEPYAQATVTHKMHVAHTITTDATGSFDFVFIPHLLFSGVQFVGTSNGLSSIKFSMTKPPNSSRISRI